MYLIDEKFKDCSPEETVNHIKNILNKYGIETEEIWQEPVAKSCYTVRVVLKGTQTGQNGKGMTKAFARASGYAELMERMVSGFLLNDIEVTNTFVNYDTGSSITLSDKDIQTEYSSNGLCAGNTYEEAFIQGCSEIVERHNSLYIFSNNMTPPKIPDESLKRYKAAYKIIKNICSEGRYGVNVYDCSLGKDYPVVGVVLTDKSRGSYGIRFGSHPVFEIALERALTEMFQGRGLKEAAFIDEFVYDKDELVSDKYIHNLMKAGTGAINASFFGSTPDYPYQLREDCSLLDNKQLCSYVRKYFKDNGCEIYEKVMRIDDFVIIHIIVPGFSGVYDKSKRIEEEETRASVKNTFLHIASAEETELMEMTAYIWSKLEYAQENTLSYFSGKPITDKENTITSCLNAIVIAFVRLKKYEAACGIIEMMLKNVQEIKDEQYLRCLLMALRGMDVRSLELFFDSTLVRRVVSDIDEVKGMCSSIGFICNNDKCEMCNENYRCRYREVEAYRAKVMELKKGIEYGR